MIIPHLCDDAFLADVAEPLTSDDEYRLWWLGQSGFLIKFHRMIALVDPYLSDTLTHKYAGTDTPHVRMSQRVVDPQRLDFIDVVTSSHNHTDHLDPETLKPLFRVNPDLTIAAPEANLDFVAKRLDLDPSRIVEFDAGRYLIANGMEMCAVPAAHESLDLDPLGRHPYLGYLFWMGAFLVAPSIYHSGDTVLHPDIVPCIRKRMIPSTYPDVAILPINGRAPERRVAGNLWGREAAQLAKELRAKLVIPCHYDMFEFNTATPDEFVAECERIGQPYRVLKLGERWSSLELSPLPNTH